MNSAIERLAGPAYHACVVGGLVLEAEMERSGLRKGLKRVCMVPRMVEGGFTYSSAPDARTLKKAKKRHPALRFLEWDEFLKKFYPERG